MFANGLREATRFSTLLLLIELLPFDRRWAAIFFVFFLLSLPAVQNSGNFTQKKKGSEKEKKKACCSEGIS